MSYTVEYVEGLPFTYKIPNGLRVGEQVIVSGRVKKHAERFHINLQADDSEDSGMVGLHFNPRQGDGEVVRNTHDENGWGDEERDTPDFPFNSKQNYTIRIIVSEWKYNIFVNGQFFCDYNHRMDLHAMQYIYIAGDTKISSVTFQEYFGAHYKSEIPGELVPGRWVIATVATHDNPNRFDVNLCMDGSDCDRAFHFNPRFVEGQVVRNSKIEGSYGDEERDGDFMFLPKNVYEIGIQVMEDGYKVYVNQVFHSFYAHRCSPSDAHYLTVNGDASVIDVDYLSFLEDNFFRSVPGLYSGDVVTVLGSVKDDVNRVQINFQGKVPEESSSSSDEEERHTDIPLHFNPRWDDGEIVLNTLRKGEWGEEERHPLPEAFFPGQPFRVVFIVGEDDYEIHVNGEHICNYGHRIKSKKVKFINLAGDAYYSSVKMSNDSERVSDFAFLYR